MSLPYRCLLLILVLVTWTGGCESPQETQARHLERGDKYFSRAQYQEAVSEYHNALRLDETDAHALQRLGLAYYQLGEFGQAFPLLLKCRQMLALLNPPRPRAYAREHRTGKMVLPGTKGDRT